MGLRIDPDELRRWQEKGLIPADVAAPPPVDERAAEKDFQAAVIREAKRRGFGVFHVYDARKSEAGWPDLVLYRERILFIELKTEDGRLTAAQEMVIESLMAAGCEVYVFRPSQWSEIMRVLA